MGIQVALSEQDLLEVEKLSQAGISPAVEISEVLQEAEEKRILSEDEEKRLRRERPFERIR